MKRLYLVLFIISLGSLALAQNKNTQDPTLRPHHSNAIKPALKAPPHKTPGLANHKAGGNAGLAPAAKPNGTDAQLNALEHQQATIHNPKPAARNAPPPALAKANNPAGTNKPMNFTYKAPNANNAMVGGTANGRKQH